MNIESSLFEITSYIPTSYFDFNFNEELIKSNENPVYYPNEHLSKILIDNYAQLFKFCSSYFNLTLSSHLTKYLVELIYSLQYWEVYHLNYIIPDFDYFLRLVDIEVKPTPFGSIIVPPKNLMVESMSQGFQFPFPYPFYNYSYHSLDPNVSKNKFKKVNIDSYIDITLKSTYQGSNARDQPRRRKRKTADSATPSKRLSVRLNVASNPSSKEETPSVKIEQLPSSPKYLEEPEEGPSSNMAISAPIHGLFGQFEEGLIHQQYPNNIKFIDGNDPAYYSSNTSSDEDLDLDNDEEDDDEEEEDEIYEGQESMSPSEYYDGDYTNSSLAVKGKGRRSNPSSKSHELTIIPSEHEKAFGDELSKKLNRNKLGIIHQCHLSDPQSGQPCMKIFYGKNELLRHQEFVHATKKKIYKCIYCSRSGNKVQSYPRHDSLARHIRRKHGVTGKENKLAVNYAKENVEIIDEAAKAIIENMEEKPLPHPQFLNSDYTIKSSYAGFLLFSTRYQPSKKKKKFELSPTMEKEDAMLDDSPNAKQMMDNTKPVPYQMVYDGNNFQEVVGSSYMSRPKIDGKSDGYALPDMMRQPPAEGGLCSPRRKLINGPEPLTNQSVDYQKEALSSGYPNERRTVDYTDEKLPVLKLAYQPSQTPTEHPILSQTSQLPKPAEQPRPSVSQNMPQHQHQLPPPQSVQSQLSQLSQRPPPPPQSQTTDFRLPAINHAMYPSSYSLPPPNLPMMRGPIMPMSYSPNSSKSDVRKSMDISYLNSPETKKEPER